MIDVVAESRDADDLDGRLGRIVEPVDAKRRWVFKTPQNDQQMSFAIVTHMADSGVKTVGFIGFADAYGEGWCERVQQARRDSSGIKVVANERYQRNDTSVTGQVLKLIGAQVPTRC